MPISDHRPLRTVLIPWVIALVTMIGLNAIVPDQARNRKIGSSGELELAHSGDDAAPLGRLSISKIFLAPEANDPDGALGSTSALILIEKHRGQPVFGTQEGANRGRAPPAGLHA